MFLSAINWMASNTMVLEETDQTVEPLLCRISLIVPVGSMTVCWYRGEEHDGSQVRGADGTVLGRTRKRMMVVPVHRRCCYGFAPGNNQT